MWKITLLILLTINSGMADIDINTCVVTGRLKTIGGKNNPSCMRICSGTLSCFSEEFGGHVEVNIWCPIVKKKECPKWKECLEVKAERYILKKDRKKKKEVEEKLPAVGEEEKASTK